MNQYNSPPIIRGPQWFRVGLMNSPRSNTLEERASICTDVTGCQCCYYSLEAMKRWYGYYTLRCSSLNQCRGIMTKYYRYSMKTRNNGSSI